MVINESNKKIAELRDIEMLTSRLADREMQIGEIIHLNDGYFYVDHVLIGGGAYVQELVLLIESINHIEIKKLITYCSVGVGEAINNLFINETLQNRMKPFQIQVVRNGGGSKDQMDYIPTMGGVHLGEGSSPEQCKIEVCYIQPGNEEVGLLSNNLSACDLIKGLVSKSLGFAED